MLFGLRSFLGMSCPTVGSVHPICLYSPAYQHLPTAGLSLSSMHGHLSRPSCCLTGTGVDDHGMALDEDRSCFLSFVYCFVSGFLGFLHRQHDFFASWRVFACALFEYSFYEM